jgi:hypothetical protein
MKKILALTAAALLLAASSLFAQAATGTQTNNLKLAVVAEASLAAVSDTTLVQTVGTAFSNFTGTTSLTFSVRTSKASGVGSGSITFKIATDFAAGSDTISVASNLTYGCGTASVGNACSGTSNAIVLNAAENIVTFANDVHGNGATAAVNWTLANNPSYETDASYSTTVTYTISAS